MPTQEERTATSRQAIIDAAVQIIGEGNYRALTTSRIEAVSGVSRGLVGYHFRSMHGLTEAVVREVNNAFVERIGGLNAASQPTGLDGVRTLVQGYLQRLGLAPRLHRVMLVLIVESVTGHPALHDAVRANNALLRDSLRDQLARGVADGSVRREIDPAAEAVVVAGTMRGIALQWLADPYHIDLAAAIAPAVAAIERTYSPD